MPATLDKALKRQVSVGNVDYILTVDLNGLWLTKKGNRKEEIELRWQDLLSVDAALAVALNASLAPRSAASKTTRRKPAVDESAREKRRPRTRSTTVK